MSQQPHQPTTPVFTSSLLPTELLVKILSYACPPTIALTECLSKSFRQLHTQNSREIWLPKLLAVTENHEAPYILPGETYKDVYKIHRAWEALKKSQLEWGSIGRARYVDETEGKRIMRDHKVLGVASAGGHWRLGIPDISTGGWYSRGAYVEMGGGSTVVCSGDYGAVVDATTSSGDSHRFDKSGTGWWSLLKTRHSSTVAGKLTHGGNVSVYILDAATFELRHEITDIPAFASCSITGSFLVARQRLPSQNEHRAHVWNLGGAPRSPCPQYSYPIPSHYTAAISETSLALASSTVGSADGPPDRMLYIKRLDSGDDRCTPIHIDASICGLTFTRTHLVAVGIENGFTVRVISLTSYDIVNRFDIVDPSQRLFNKRVRLSECGTHMCMLSGHGDIDEVTEGNQHQLVPYPERFAVLNVVNRKLHGWTQETKKFSRLDVICLIWLWYREDGSSDEGECAFVELSSTES